MCSSDLARVVICAKGPRGLTPRLVILVFLICSRLCVVVALHPVRLPKTRGLLGVGLPARPSMASDNWQAGSPPHVRTAGRPLKRTDDSQLLAFLFVFRFIA